MNVFSISDLQHFSGIKAHTIRMWEQRYKALQPLRSEGNTRYYNGSQLRRLLNIVSLMSAGHKVSQLGFMADEALCNLVNQHLSKPVADPTDEYLISQIISAAVNYDEAYFDKIFLNAVLRSGLKEAYIKIIYPVLQRLGLLWAGNKLHPAQEHFVTNLFRRKMLSAIDALPPPSSSKNSWLLFLPENEFHDLGLLLSSFLLRQAGIKVIYLGENMPLDSMKNAVAELRPTALLTFLIGKKEMEQEKAYVSSLSKTFRACKIFAACEGSWANGLKKGKNVAIVRSVDELEKEIRARVV